MIEQPERPRVLIVEDEQVVAADLARTLLDLGYEVLPTARTGSGAIRSAEQERPDLVLMDIQLKGSMDGIAAADEIVRRWQIPVVFVTANANDEVLSRAKATGAYGYLIKPFRSKELNATLLVALHQHRRARELFSEHAWLRTTLSSLRDGVLATDSQSKIRFMNPVAEQLTGWPINEAVGRHVREVFSLRPLTGEPVDTCQIERALIAQRSVEKERFLLVARDGRRIPIEDSASPIIERGVVSGAVSVFLDISERLRREVEAEQERDRLEEQVHATEEALGHTRAELRALSSHLITAQEDERRRIARELHDDLNQRTAILELHTLQLAALTPEHSGEAAELLNRMRAQISELDRGIRSVSHRLHPSALEDLGLGLALRSLVEDFNNVGAEVSLRVQESLPDIGPDSATTLYRIAQEGLRNATKHAHGAPVHVTLSSNNSYIQLLIEDAGPGFDITQVRHAGGLGLLTMQERARLAGGTLLIKTNSGSGTTLAVRIPLQKNVVSSRDFPSA